MRYRAYGMMQRTLGEMTYWQTLYDFEDDKAEIFWVCFDHDIREPIGQLIANFNTRAECDSFIRDLADCETTDYDVTLQGFDVVFKLPHIAVELDNATGTYIIHNSNGVFRHKQGKKP